MTVIAENQPTTGLLLPPPSLPKNPYERFYPKNWPLVPFHQGEIDLQRQAGVHEKVMSYAPRVIRPYLPEQHVDFYEHQPLVVAAARDQTGSLWATFLMKDVGFISSPDPTSPHINARPVVGDALEGAFEVGADVGLLGIELATRRRNRVNGRVAATGEGIVFSVDQSFGNCPQYIKPRDWWSAASVETKPPLRSDVLSDDQIQRIRQAETVFIASGYRGEGEDVRYGNDVSHRGGVPGFLMVRSNSTIVLPEFPGNNHFNSLGNLVMDSRMGLTIPSFEDGGLLQLSGWAEVDMDLKNAENTYPGALRLITFHVEQVNELQSGSLPLRWRAPKSSASRQLEVFKIVQETEDVKSFHMRPLEGELWPYDAGQHLPIQVSATTERTYSLSGDPGDTSEYRISVKRVPFGKASNHLHDHIQVGDKLNVSRPAGDFVVQPSNKTLVLVSAGIGITPMLSMLFDFVATDEHREVVWVHGARDEAHYQLRSDVEGLQRKLSGRMQSHIVYSRPGPHDSGFDSVGRVDTTLLQKLVDVENSDFYMCGPSPMMASLEEGLLLNGARTSSVHFETF